MFSSGDIFFAEFANTNCLSESASLDWPTVPGDPALDALVWRQEYQFTTEDAIVYEFDFIPPVGAVSVQIPFVFATEEYPEYVQNLFDDVFAFYIAGQNKALIPGTSDPIKVSTVVSAANFRDNCDGSINSRYDGYTPVYTFSHLVQAGTTYHVKIAIADTRDGNLDSAVFIGRATYQR